MIREIASLPVHDVLPALCEALASSPAAVLSAPPGSGKTTAVPLALLQQPWLQGQTILMLEPRRLAVRASAARMAELLNERVGQSVGYRVRFDSQLSRQTRIEVVTEGILTRRLQQDPELKGVGLVIFDEFHERNLHADLGLALCLDIIQGLRDELRLLVMSATLDTAAVSALLGGAPVVSGEGQLFPVDIQYLDGAPKKRMAEATAKAVRRALSEQQGDTLVFLPGVGEIQRVAELLCGMSGVEICPLYGGLSQAAQDRAIRPHPQGQRRVVLATAIAETSLTIEGITTVVDAGWSRQPRFDPNTGLTRLETVQVSRAAADQRAGRAGRLASGVCYRLWSASTQSALQAHTPPEILSADMAPLALELAQWGVTDPAQLNWLDSPPAGAYAQALDLLKRLGALDGRGLITATGRRMAMLPAHPRLAQMLLQAEAVGQGALAADLAALLSERDLMLRAMGETKPVDIEQRLRLLACWRTQGARAVTAMGGDARACRQVDRASRQYRRSLGSSRSAPVECSVGALLASAYPDRIVQLRAASSSRYLLSSGRGVALPEGDSLSGCDYLVAAQLDAGRSEGSIFLAAPVMLSEVRSGQKSHIKIVSSVQWDSREQAVSSQAKESLGALTLASFPIKKADPDAINSAMLEGIRQMGIAALPWSDALRGWQMRLLSLRHWQPDGGWPDLSDRALMESMEEWLAPWLAGISRKSHLQRLDLEAILSSTLTWERQRALEQGAPATIQVPSGSRKRLRYQPGEPPVLAVRLQEMFGLADTPAVCWGEVPVLLHLLSPAQRPIQVTQDLRGFWERTYSEVKKELKGRYPKHYWPDDPWSARPTARAKPRR